MTKRGKRWTDTRRDLAFKPDPHPPKPPTAFDRAKCYALGHEWIVMVEDTSVPVYEWLSTGRFCDRCHKEERGVDPDGTPSDVLPS